MSEDALALARWRLVLGRFAETRMPQGLGGGAGYDRMDALLDYLYGREYQRRGVRQSTSGGGAGLGPSALSIPEWIRGVRELFPADTCEIITRHALERYGLTELVTDPETLRKLEPSYDLLKALLTFKGMMNGPALDMARQIVRKVIEELRRRIAAEVRPVLWGRLDRLRRTRFKSARNLDLKRTVRSNLASWDRERKRLLARDLVFRARVERHLPWRVIMVVDCSGSMVDSVIYSAVMAGIIRGLPWVQIRLLAFDTSVVDFSDAVDDPVELLMSVQLGGGTDIAGALGTAAAMIDNPTRTVVILVTDFDEGGSPVPMLAAIKKMRGEGVRVLGLAALDESAQPRYNRQIAQRCADVGAEIGAMTPRHLAEWLGRMLS